MRQLIHSTTFMLFIFLGGTACASIKLGDQLSAFSLATIPQSFDYKPNGFNQMISVYPASLTSSRNGQFNFEVIEAGFCPKSIIDLKNRSWYVPMKTAERAVIKSTTAEQHNPLCTVSVDYEGDAIKHWRLNKKSTTIIVDGKGKVIFVDEGVLGSEGQKKVISLLKHNGKPYTEWPGRKPPSQH